MTKLTRTMTRKRRGRGEGSIYQRSDGTWCATYSSGYDSNGKRKRRTVFGITKEDVCNKMARVQTSKLDGVLSEPTKLRLSGYLDRWLKDAAKPSIRKTTYLNYEGIVENHINPRIGGVALSKLNPAHVQGLYAEMERDGVSAYVRHMTHAVLRRAQSRRSSGDSCRGTRAMPLIPLALPSGQSRRSRLSRCKNCSGRQRTIVFTPSTFWQSVLACALARSSGCSGSTWTSRLAP